MSSQDNITVIDHGDEITINFDDCMKYHGKDSIGGLALGFRLMQLAFSELTSGKAPDRTSISFRTTFAGPGLRDSVELISRAFTRGVYKLEEASVASSNAPESPAGPLWFEVTIDGKSAAYEVIQAAVNPEFVRLGKLSRSGKITDAEKPLWTEQKQKLAAAVLAAPPSTYLRRI
ncbi:hypothetical protein WJT86_08715 [Microvirga sp. W0021]|uniref:Uncharacterized protein n=1 Tax=Hohaiivirga grylli TaxID=3133970 RepID=A0ABV0BJG7_9HYPH